MLMINTLPMTIHPHDGVDYDINVPVVRIGCSRNANRDMQSTQKFIDGVRKEGSKMHGPAGVCFKSRYLLTNEDVIEVQGPHTSGEIEFIVFTYLNQLFVSVGSDHNDRSIDQMWTPLLGKIQDTAKTKQMVPAVVGRDAWPYDDVKEHWDDIVLKSMVSVSGNLVTYQEFALAELLGIEHYINNHSWIKDEGSFLLGGSGPILLSASSEMYTGQSNLEGIMFPTDFYFEMIDPVLDRTISHSYDALSLEEIDSFSL